ncbi:hypothetical protein [Halosegnis marinus]|uniref:hypothetical protein n=1 Tax=Halosegnis marinus TaxID=3034023 RepID=UPI003613FCB5
MSEDAPIDGPSVEAHLASMGDPDETDRWTQWLTGPSTAVDGHVVHRRTTAPLATGADVALAPGPTLNWHEEDGGDARVGYISQAHDDELLVMVQYALDPLATLGRIAASVCSPRVFARCLDDEQVGEAFEALFADFERELAELSLDTEPTTTDMLVDGLQAGWVSPTERDRDALADRWLGVRAHLLERVGQLTGPPGHRGDPDARGRVFAALHGLTASMTSLLYAAGYTPVINVRVPQTATLQEDRHYRRAFLDFCRYTIPKHAVYESETGWHSWFRQVADPDAVGWDTDKLSARLPPGLDPDSPMANPTTKWVLSGPGIDTFQDGIRRAIGAEQRRLRTRADGEGAPPALDIAIADASHPDALDAIIETLAEAKGFRVPETPSQAPAPIAQLRRRLTRVLGCDDRAGCPPQHVADALLRLRAPAQPRPLRAGDIDATLARLPAACVVPDAPDTSGRILQCMLASDGPCGRKQALERLGIHPNTWDRRLRGLRERGLVTAVEGEGYVQYEATLSTPEEATTEPDQSRKPNRDPAATAAPHRRSAQRTERRRHEAPSWSGMPPGGAPPLAAALSPATRVVRLARPVGMPLDERMAMEVDNTALSG